MKTTISLFENPKAIELTFAQLKELTFGSPHVLFYTREMLKHVVLMVLPYGKGVVGIRDNGYSYLYEICENSDSCMLYTRVQENGLNTVTINW